MVVWGIGVGVVIYEIMIRFFCYELSVRVVGDNILLVVILRVDTKFGNIFG